MDTSTKRIIVPAAEEILGQYFPVLDHGFVALIDYMGGDAAIERAARCSYHAIGEEARTIKETRNLIRYLFRHKHTSPFEQVEVQVHIGMPIFVMRQFVRHRTVSLNEYSGRYSPMPMMFYSPTRERVQKQAKDNKQGSSGEISNHEWGTWVYNSEQTRWVAEKQYTQALEMDIAKETSRIDLPLSMYTYLYWKIDMRNLLHLIGLRSDPHAQWEIRAFSDVLAGIAQRVCPLAFDAFQDYQQNAVAFSQTELRAIRALSHFHVSPLVWDNPPEKTKKEINEVLAEYGVSGREASEFWGKLRLQSKRDFSLDLETAKSSHYYEKMVENHMLEVSK